MSLEKVNNRASIILIISLVFGFMLIGAGFYFGNPNSKTTEILVNNTDETSPTSFPESSATSSPSASSSATLVNVSSELDNKDVARELFDSYLKKFTAKDEPIQSRIAGYTYHMGSIQTNDKNDNFCFSATYSVKPTDFNQDYWKTGNVIADENTGWVNDKTAFSIVSKVDNQYQMDTPSTGGVCR